MSTMLSWEESLEIICRSFTDTSVLGKDIFLEDNIGYNNAQSVFKKIRHHVVTILDLARLNQMETKQLKEHIQAIRSSVPRYWMWRESHVTYRDIAECLCTEGSSENVVSRIHALITDRRGCIGFVYEPEESDTAEYLFHISDAELWLILSILARTKLDSKLAISKLNRIYTANFISIIEQVLDALQVC